MKKRTKRMLCAALSVLLVLGSFRIAPMRYVEAAALSTEASAEILMLLWNLMVNAQIATGAGEMAVNYDQEKLTFEVFMDTLAHDVMGMPEHENLLGEVHMADGSVVLLDDFVTSYVNGTITLDPEIGEDEEEEETSEDTVPEDDDYLDEDGYLDVDKLPGRKAYINLRSRQINGEDDFVKFLQENGWLPEGEEPPKGPDFTKIVKVVFGTGTIAALSTLMSKFWGGEIEGVDLSKYQDEYVYTGVMEKGVDGLYRYEGKMGYCGDTSEVWKEYTIYRSSLEPHALCLLREGDYCNLKALSSDGEYLKNATFGGSSSGTSGCAIYRFEKHFVYANFPIFNDATAALNYLKTGDDTGCLNKVSIDRQALAANIPKIMKPIAGVPVSVNALQDMYTRMKNAYQTQIKPQIDTSTDTETNTQTYTDTMTEAVTETKEETETDTDTGTEPSPSPAPAPEPETEEETTPPKTDIDIADYELDLKMVFPFCIPFDFITLLETLDAEPVAPKFEFPVVIPALNYEETVVIDMSIFDDVAEIMRTCEIISFVIFLMFATTKVIRW